MDNKEFDDIIKKKLESLNTKGSEDAWDLFKKKWDNEPISGDINSAISNQDKELDDKIKKDLRDLRIPFNSKHWIILKEQLELEALFKKKLFVAKSVELLVLAFLVIGILNLWPIQKDVYHISVYDSPMVASVPVNKETAEKFDAQEKIRIAERQVLINSTKSLVKKTFSPKKILPSETNERLLISSKILPKILPKIRTKSTNVNPSNSIEKNSIIFPFIKSISEESPILIQTDALDVIAFNAPITALAEKGISELEIPIRPIGFPDIVLNKKSNNKEENTYLSFAIGPKVNLINSPFDPVYGFDPYTSINTNFNISAKINKEIGPIELYAGLGYTNTSYVPRLVDEYYQPLERQYYVASLENIKFKTFNVPLGVRYNVIETNNYQLYAATGVDLNIIADSEYIIQDVPYGNTKPTPPPSTQNFINENTKLSQKEFNKGILAGGNLKDNLYATASIGLGFNLNLSSHSGIFIEPKYSHFISSKGIGPNEDKVHGLSIDLGFRYQLN